MSGACVYSEALHPGETCAEAGKYLNQMDELLYGKLKECLTSEERVYVSVKNPEERDIIKFSWRYEDWL